MSPKLRQLNAKSNISEECRSAGGRPAQPYTATA